MTFTVLYFTAKISSRNTWVCFCLIYFRCLQRPMSGLR